MYKIENCPSGYILSFAGNMDDAEMQRWHGESRRVLASESRFSFGVIINMKDLQPVASNARRIMVDGQKLYKDKGIKRSAVILVNAEDATSLKIWRFSLEFIQRKDILMLP